MMQLYVYRNDGEYLGLLDPRVVADSGGRRNNFIDLNGKPGSQFADDSKVLPTPPGVPFRHAPVATPMEQPPAPP